jgi:hypothetical protein
MNTKIEKIMRLSELVQKTSDYIIGYSEFNELKSLLNELTFVTDQELKKMLSEKGYSDADKIFDAIQNFRNLTPSEKGKVSGFIGTISGATILTQIKVLKEFKNSHQLAK